MSLPRASDSPRVASALVWALWLAGAAVVALSALAVWQLLSPDSCLTGDFDARSVRRLSSQWWPPRVVCEVVAKDGAVQTAHLNYWIAYALAAVTLPAAAVATWWRRTT